MSNQKPDINFRNKGGGVMLRTVLFTLIGYFSGSVLYANVFGAVFGKKEMYQNSTDKNPGTANAYKYGGFWCGTLTLIFDLLKGFLPVFIYLLSTEQNGWGLISVLVSPVIGHIFPIFAKFHGGKGIAVTFGCLLGLFPYCKPLFLFAIVFIFLSVCLRISPHFYRTIAAYPLAFLAMLIAGVDPAVRFGFLIITAAVCLKMYLSKEERGRVKIRILWMH